MPNVAKHIKTDSAAIIAITMLPLALPLCVHKALSNGTATHCTRLFTHQHCHTDTHTHTHAELQV